MALQTIPLPAGWEASDIRNAVRERYSQVGAHPEGQYNFRVGRVFAEDLGYPREVLDQLFPGIWEAFTGVSTPSLAAELQPGDTVVDFGCGGGLDLVLLSWQVGPRGRAIGIDFAPGMVERARRNLALLDLQQAEVRETSADQTGLPDASVDWVIANGILNLSPDKAAILGEIFRILRPGGRFLLAETTLTVPLPPESNRTLDDWFR